VRLTRNDAIWAIAIAAIWILAGLDALSPRLGPDNVAVLWLPNGVLAVAMLRRIDRPNLLLAYTAVAFVAAAVPGALRTGEAALGWSVLALANAAECFALARTAHYFGGPTFAFTRPRNVAIWSAAAIGASVLSMFLAWAASNLGIAPVDFANVGDAAMNWILGDACAHITLGAALVAATSPDAAKQVARMRAQASRASVMAGAIVLSGVMAFAGPRLWSPAEHVPHPGYLGLLLPALMWAAFRYGPLGAAFASLLALAPGVAISSSGWGPFAAAELGTARDLQILILAIAGTTLLVGVLGAALRESRDRAASADRGKTLFLSRVGHELRTPLNGVIGAADLLARDLADAPHAQQDRLDLVRSSARTLAAVVEDLVEYAAVHREGVALRPVVFEAARPFEDAVAIFAPQARWNNVPLTLSLHGFEGLRIETDPARLRQVLFALVANAVEATAEGRITIEATATPVASDRVRLVATVQDTGPGVPEDQRERIFEPFAQGEAERHRPSSGLGLGLAVAKETIEALGGALTLTDASPGATFRFELTAPRAPAFVDDAQRALGRALLAEDNPTNRIVLTAMLSTLGFDVVAVETGAEALEAARARDFALIVMDIQMPVMDGEEATERIRALDGPRGKTPIVVVTAHALAGDDKRYLAAGATRVLEKPVALGALAEAVAAALGP
jgi:signal transduction histidine kinase/CheY-like chemotaxis protein